MAKGNTIETNCKKCKGTGERRKGEKCATCEGSGRVTISRDEDFDAPAREAQEAAR